MLEGMLREREEELFSSKTRQRGWLQGTTETQAELDLRLRDSARSELGLLREEPGPEARGGMRLGGGAVAKLVLEPGPKPGAPAFRFSQLFPWPAAGRERKGRGGQQRRQQEKKL